MSVDEAVFQTDDLEEFLDKATPHLRKLCLQIASTIQCDVFARIASCIGKGTLRVLVVHNSEAFGDTELHALSGALCRLEELRLERLPWITDSGVLSLTSLGALETLSLDSCSQVSGAFALGQWSTPCLKVLSLNFLQSFLSPALVRLWMMSASHLTTLSVAGASLGLLEYVMGFVARDVYPSLTELDLSHTLSQRHAAEGSASFFLARSLPQLEHLTLCSCCVVPSEMHRLLQPLHGLRLRSLVVLQCDTPLTDASAAQMGVVCDRLARLSIRGAKLCSGGNYLFAAPLTSLQLRHCTSLCSSALTGLPSSLTSLSLEGCESVNDVAVSQLSSLRSLQRLELSRCGITDTSLKELRPLVRLQVLSLSSCWIVGTCFDVLSCYLVELRELDVSYCRSLYPGVFFKHLPDFGMLRTINVTGCGLPAAQMVPLLFHMQQHLELLYCDSVFKMRLRADQMFRHDLLTVVATDV